MSNDGIGNNTKKGQPQDVKKYLLLTEAFSQATTYLIFALICTWLILNNSPKLDFELIILSIVALFAICMFFVFTTFMFSPKRVENFRNFLMVPNPSDSIIKKVFKIFVSTIMWTILTVIFIDALVQGTNRMPDNLRHIVLLVGVIWLIVIPLSSLIKLIVIDEKGYRKFTRIWKRGDVKEESPIDTLENDQLSGMFRTDQPIQSFREDLLNRAPFARSLGDAILNYKRKDSIVLGLLGTWGSGKTSIINMALEHINDVHKHNEDKLNPFIVKFNPWNYADKDQLIRQFFRQLSVTLRRKDYGANAEKIGIGIETYASLLDPLACIPQFGLIPKMISKVLRLFGKSLTSWGYQKSNDLESIKSELNKLLDGQERKIIIIIDDIDRLSDIEIRQIFQLVKSLCDFHNTIYILAFDKKVAISALDRVQEGYGAKYLHKVVQVPFEIPLITKKEIDKLLFSQLDELLKDIPQEKWDRVRWGNVYLDGLRHFFNTIRDVNLYINSLRFSLDMVKDEVDIMDFLAITGLQVFVPEVYYGIRDNKEEFSGVFDSTSGAREVSQERTKALCDGIISKSDEYPQEKVKELLKLLFPKLEAIYSNVYYGSESLREWRKGGRICSPDMFDVFFRLSIPKDEISRTELEAILSIAVNPDTFAETLLKLNEDGKIIKLLERLEDYTRSDIKEENIENIVTVLMDIGDIFPEGDNGFLEIDTSLRILRICHQLISRLGSQEKRFAIIKNAVVKANRSLYTIVREIGTQGQEHGKYSEKKNKPENELTVGATQLDELEKLACSKIEIWANDGRLANHNELVFILYRWREWGQSSNVESYVNDMISTDSGLVNFITSFLYKVKSKGLGSYVSQIRWHIRIKNISSFVNISEMELRLRNILSSEEFSHLDDKKQLAVKVLLDTIDGKIKDPLNDID